MNKLDMFCASHASTAICMNMDLPSSSTIQLGGRAIDRHNPIIRDHRRTPKGQPFAPCTSQSPSINPEPYPLLRSSQKTASRKLSDKKDKKGSSKVLASGGSKDKKIFSNLLLRDDFKKSWANSKAADIITPSGSSRYLLSDHKDLNFDPFSDHFDPVLALVASNSTNQLRSSFSSSSSTISSNNPPRPTSNQVVVLRVSLHCRGCEGKVRKHLSRMEGVRSFSIDFAAKKVTIVGDVTPLRVLASVSKVKSAQFWTPPTSAPPLSNKNA